MEVKFYLSITSTLASRKPRPVLLWVHLTWSNGLEQWNCSRILGNLAFFLQCKTFEGRALLVVLVHSVDNFLIKIAPTVIIAKLLSQTTFKVDKKWNILYPYSWNRTIKSVVQKSFATVFCKYRIYFLFYYAFYCTFTILRRVFNINILYKNCSRHDYRTRNIPQRFNTIKIIDFNQYVYNIKIYNN